LVKLGSGDVAITSSSSAVAVMRVAVKSLSPVLCCRPLKSAEQRCLFGCTLIAGCILHAIGLPRSSGEKRVALCEGHADLRRDARAVSV
jgi:hypothetical protein